VQEDCGFASSGRLGVSRSAALEGEACNGAVGVVQDGWFKRSAMHSILAQSRDVVKLCTALSLHLVELTETN
jgi:hypothetical protein